MKKLFLLLIAICAISLGMSAQQVVRGQVTDANGEPLIGATIQPVGGGNGAATDVNALAITKLDGTAKGGVVIGISDQFQIPVKYIGVGEKIEQLQVFNRLEFVDSLFPEQ